MTPITAKQLTKRVQQLDDAQAGTVLLFIEFLLTNPKARQAESRANLKTFDELNRIYADNPVDLDAAYKLALRAMTRKGLPKCGAAQKRSGASTS